jgi:hypothetical protein
LWVTPQPSSSSLPNASSLPGRSSDALLPTDAVSGHRTYLMLSGQLCLVCPEELQWQW